MKKKLLTKKERNMLADKFVEAAEHVFIGVEYSSHYSCTALKTYKVSLRKLNQYQVLFKPDENDSRYAWIGGQFRTFKAEKKWRIDALLSASEMIRQGMFFE